MAKIKIRDIPAKRKITKEEMKRLRGGAYVRSPYLNTSIAIKIGDFTSTDTTFPSFPKISRS